jgi:hypothetical protein
MLAAALLLTLLSAAPEGDDLPRSAIPAKELDKCTKDVAAFFDALERQDTDLKAKGQLQTALDAINKAMGSAAKRVKVDSPLKAVGDWEYLLEVAKPDNKALAGQAGKGLFRTQFVDKYNNDASTACLLSLPSTWNKSEQLMPVVLALTPPLGAKGAELETKAKEMAAAIYADVLETHIVLVPLGPETGAAGKGEIAEVSKGWFEGDGLRVLFTAFRILLEQAPFDRSRVVLDGWGDAGLDALRVATSLPSWFAGVVIRSGDLGGDDVLYENLGNVPLLYVNGKGDGRSVDVEALKARTDVPAGVTVVEEAGSAMAPSEETRKAVATWLGERRRSLAPAAVHFKLAEPRFQSCDWLKATQVNWRKDAKPGDKDFPRIDAKIDRTANKITLDTVNVLEVNVYLSDALVDLDKPVIFTVNGKDKATLKLTRDLRAMLETRFNNADGYYGLYTASHLIERIDPNAPASESDKKKKP